MLTLKQFISEANLGNSPDNYPPGSLILLNKNKQIGNYPAHTEFKVVEISNEIRKFDYDLIAGSTTKNILYITLSDTSNREFTIRISKSNANAYFLKGKKQNSTDKILFTNKALTPDNLHMSGLTMDYDSIITHLESSLKFQPDVTRGLIDLAKSSYTSGTTIQIDTSMFSTDDLPVIAKDFGEIMSAIWIMKNLHFKTISFPNSSNQPLIDFYGNRFNVPYPFSVKSGSGSKVTIQNILNAIENKNVQFDSIFNAREMECFLVLQKITELPMREGMIEAHKILHTPGIKELANIMECDVSSITNISINLWLETKSGDELKIILNDFYKKLGSYPSDQMFNNREKNRLVVGPLGESLHKLLNSMNDMQHVLNTLARLVTTIQINITIKAKSVTFKYSKFKESKFKFGWAGYSGGNKLGFKLI